MTIKINLDLKNQEYFENIQDEKLKIEIQKSKELDNLLPNIKL
jgi:hypothetical protein